MLQTIRSLHWRTGVALMLRIVSSNALAKWSSIFHFGSSRCYKSEGWHSAAAGAIMVYTNFTQLSGTLSIANSLAKLRGGAVNLGAPPAGISRCCLSWLWGCGRFCFSCDFQVTYILFDGFACSEILYTNLLEKMLQTIRSLHWKTGVDIMLRILTCNSLAKWSSIFHFGSSRCYESEGFPKCFGRKPQHLLGGRCHLREHLHPVRWHSNHQEFVGRERRCGAPWSAFLGEFRDDAWAGFEAVVLVVLF